MSTDNIQLVIPTVEHLASYKAALERHWTPNNLVGDSWRHELSEIEQDPAAFLAGMTDLDASLPPILLPDGTYARRIPGFRRWIWDGQFCGSVGLRWQPGTTELPPTCLGHIGYSIVPWRSGCGVATRALALMVEQAREVTGLPFVELTTKIANRASQRVIEKNGGVLVEEFVEPEQYGGGRAFRFRIALG